MTKIENWSILSDNVIYEQHDEKLKTPHKLDLTTLQYHQHKELYCKLKGEKSHTLEVDFGINPETLKSNYLDTYEGVHTEMVLKYRFDENSDLSMTYLGQTKRDLNQSRREIFHYQTRFYFRKTVRWY